MKNKKIISIALFSLISFNLISCDKNEDKKTGYIDFYALNDFHGQINEDYYKVGLVKCFSYLKEKKNSDPNHTIVLSSGDMFQGTFESNYSKGEFVINAMNEVGFDFMTVGNHEFDWGIDKLKENVEKMDFPLLGNNVFYKGTNDLLECLTPYITIEKSGFKVGVIGSIQPNINGSILRTVSNLFDYRRNIDIIKEASDKLYLEENCDVVILSTHDGNESTYQPLTNISENSNRPYVSAVFLGHDHFRKEGYYRNTNIPYIEAQCNSEFISNIKLELERVDGVTTVTKATYQNLDSIDVCGSQDNELKNIYNYYSSIYTNKQNEVIGYLDSSLTKDEIAYLVSKGLYYFVNNNLDVFKYKPLIGLVNSGGGIRATLKSGLVTFADIYSCIPFENIVVEANCDEGEFASYQTRYNPYIPDTNFEKDVDGLYHVATINYVSEDWGNKNVTYSTYLYCDAFVDSIKKGYIEEIEPRGN